MKVTCTQADLSKGLATAGRALSSRPALPILACLHLSTGEDCLRLRATNLEIGICCDVPATIEEAGAVALPARLLADFVNSLPTGSVTLTLAVGAFTAQVTGQRSQAHIRGMDPSEYPTLEYPAEADTRYCFESAILKEAIAQVAFAAATDESRPVLTAVLLRGHEGRVSLAAADAFRLATRDVPFVTCEDGETEVPLLEDLLVPARTLTELARILPPDSHVALRLPGHRHQAWFQTEHLTLTTRLVEGRYPNYMQIIPATHTMRAVVETAAFRAAVKSILLFARESSNITCLHIVPSTDEAPGALTIEASSENLGETVSTLEASVVGDEMRLIFNATYLQEILAAIPTPEVILEGIGSTRPGVFRPVGAPDSTYVVMPMQINR
jgi:DNA polymerase-3 subunit beta